ncbi:MULTISPECIES: carbohydrate ABC transporter permease [unclassified Rathayibacter]|uniref:carbohydrate ABC transporter permease n=1 Tax=unclassified Rathayibacter TaxID=2609250 RepID=UPI000F4B8867|nr:MULTISPECIES: sugar ABC transporter permease [unclassified Rathayibacter]ROP49154.1 carbohydrate ABC transporter membrane protein 1 (CUT1 family) [Rathayibacter sp. PhB186]ROS50729.1 carbohydrate ABC transporter membrane protein 1 (CUT1 family) [Rathayibacter sp. PhB185]
MTEITGDAATGVRFAKATSKEASASRRRRGLRGPNGELRITPLLFLVVPLVLLITLTYYPVGNMIWYSFTDWDGISLEKETVGLDNYLQIFTRPEYFQVFFVSLYYFAASFVQMFIALYFATILSFDTRFRNFFKGVIFFPYLLNGVAVALVFLFFFRPGGTLDATLAGLGLGALGTTPQWLGNPDWVNVSLGGVSIWRYTGLNFVLFLGAIQSIPDEIYEAADLDGANSWHKFRFIIVPGIKRIISLSFILAIAGSLSVFEIPYIMTGGSNGSSTFVITTIQQAFVFQRVGFASAMAVILLIIVLLVTYVQRRLVPDDDVALN